MPDKKLRRAQRLLVALKGLEQLETAEFARHEQRLLDETRARDQALESLNGDGAFGGLFIDLLAKCLCRMDREIQVLSGEQAARLQSLTAAHRRTEAARELVVRAESESAKEEEKRTLEAALERSLILSAQGPRKMVEQE